MEKAVLDVTGIPTRRLNLKCAVKDSKKAAIPIGASRTKGSWTYPPDELVVQVLKHHFKDELILTPEAQEWFDGVLNRRHLLEDIRGKIETQPQGIKGEMQDYQLQMLAFGLQAQKFINGDDRGLGKTLDALSLVECRPEQYNRVLIVCPGYLKFGWEREIYKWTYSTPILPRGERSSRTKSIEQYFNGSAKYLIINYEMLRIKSSGGYPELLEFPWDMIIFDEAHRLRGRNTQHIKNIKSLVRNIPFQMLTGNPVDRPEAVWQLLNLIDPLKYSSFWAFVEYYCNIVDNFFGKEIVGVNSARMAQFQYTLMPHIYRRSKIEVAPHLPLKERHIIEVELEGTQKTFYNRLEKQMVIELANGDLELVTAVAAKQTRLQQAIANPAVLGGKDNSIIERTVLQLLEDILEGTNKVIVGTWYVFAADMLEEKIGKKYKVFRMGSHLKDIQRDAVEKEFKEYTSPCVLVGTIGSMSEGLNIDECDHIIFADKSYLILDNEQFEDRIHRMTSTRTKHYWDIVVRNTVSEDKAQVLEERTETRNEILSMTAICKKMISRVKGGN